MKAPKAWLLLCVLVLMASGATLIGWMQGYLGNSLKRISREHSINLPSSSAMGHNDGLVNLTALGDFGATGDFVINVEQIGELLKQINEIKQGGEIKERRLNWDYHVPREFGQELRYIEGISKDGNIMTVTIYELDGMRVGVCLRTQWN